LSSAWERQDVEDRGLSLYWGRVQFISVGEESDAFLQALDEVYETNVGRQRMRDQVSYVAVSLAGVPFQIENESVKMKLFVESDAEEPVIEFYLNIDPQNSSVQFREKSTDYRRGVVLSLSVSAS
jgi:hypothetical protein